MLCLHEALRSSGCIYSARQPIPGEISKQKEIATSSVFCAQPHLRRAWHLLICHFDSRLTRVRLFTCHTLNQWPSQARFRSGKFSGACLPTSSVDPRAECFLTLYLAKRCIYSWVSCEAVFTYHCRESDDCRHQDHHGGRHGPSRLGQVNQTSLAQAAREQWEGTPVVHIGLCQLKVQAQCCFNGPFGIGTCRRGYRWSQIPALTTSFQTAWCRSDGPSRIFTCVKEWDSSEDHKFLDPSSVHQADGRTITVIQSPVETVCSDEPAMLANPSSSPDPARSEDSAMAADPASFANPARLSDPAKVADPARSADLARAADPASSDTPAHQSMDQAPATDDSSSLIFQSLPKHISQSSLLDFMSMMALIQKCFDEGTPAVTPETTAWPAKISSPLPVQRTSPSRLPSPDTRDNETTFSSQKFPVTYRCREHLHLAYLHRTPETMKPQGLQSEFPVTYRCREHLHLAYLHRTPETMKPQGLQSEFPVTYRCREHLHLAYLHRTPETMKP